MEEIVAEKTLNALSRIIREEGRDTADGLDLPQVETVGLLKANEEQTEGPDPEPAHAVYRDGLTLLSPLLSLEMGGARIWQPQEGLLHGS